MFISWDPPYTLPGLTVQYIISVGTEQYELNSTNYTYCPLNLTKKEYMFNITTSNKVGNSSISNITIGFQSSKIILSHSYYIHMHNTGTQFLARYQKQITRRINNNWTLCFLIPVSIIPSHTHCIQQLFAYRLISFVLEYHLLILQ